MLHIICFGNELHGDDGFGNAVYRCLIEHPMPADVRLFDAGIAGLNALPLFEGCDRVLLVDALESQGTPGRLVVLTEQQLECLDGTGADCHGAGLPYLLRAVRVTISSPPKITLLGAEVGRVQAFSPGLTDALSVAVKRALYLIQGMLSNGAGRELRASLGGEHNGLASND